jgi:DNA-binding NarL/FixJ family response regulator
LAVPFLLIGFAVLLRITYCHSRRLSVIAGAFLACAMVGLAAVHGAEMTAFATATGGDRAAAVSMLDGDHVVAPMVVLLVLFLGGAVLGTITLAVAMWRSPLLPRVAAVGVIAFAVLDFALGSPVVSHVVALLNAFVGGPAMTIRVLVVDDHPVYRSGLSGVLAEEDDIEVVGEAASGTEALELVPELHPDVVLMDLHMPDVTGIEATHRLGRDAPDVHVLVLTMLDDDESVLAALRAGARGYLVKGAAGEQIVGTVRAVAAGQAVFGPDVRGRPRPARRRRSRRTGGSTLPRAHGPRAGDPRPAGRRPVEHRDRAPARAVRQDGAQPRVEHLHEAAGRRPLRRDRESTRGGTRDRSLRSRTPTGTGLP